MSNTSRLNLPYILQSQSQKEVTHNDSLNRLDAFVTPVVGEVADTPPSSPAVGDLVIVGTSPTGAFAGQNNNIAQYQTGGWLFYTPFKWMDAVVESLDSRMAYDGSSWVQFGLIMKDTGEYLRVEHWQEDITVSGANIDTTLVLPDRSSVMAVNVRVLTAITGATSFSVGISGDTARYGSGIGAGQDSTNIGMTYNPITYYSNTPIKLTSSGGNFTAGIVRVTAQYFKPHGPWSW